MKVFCRNVFLGSLGLILACSLIGCSKGAKDKPSAQEAKSNSGPAKAEDPKAKAEAEIKEALAKLTPEDRKLAEAQKFCAVQTKSRLGSMDVPVKLMLKGEPVFLCCDGCQKTAEADPEKTLQSANQLKAGTAAGQ